MHPAMAVTELDTFINKFHQLWKAGLTAHLDLDTHAGNAWVGLRVQLGHQVPGPSHHPVHPPHQVSSSRERRRARRLAAREHADKLAAEEAVSTSEEEATKILEPVEETNSAANVTEKVTEKEVSDKVIESAEKAKDFFECPICDFSSTWENGLRVHMGRKHENIEQIDGCTEVEDLDIDEKYDLSENYWKNGRIGIAYHIFLAANLVLDASDLPEDEKKEEKVKILDARKAVFGRSFNQFPPWNK